MIDPNMYYATVPSIGYAQQPPQQQQQLIPQQQQQIQFPQPPTIISTSSPMTTYPTFRVPSYNQTPGMLPPPQDPNVSQIFFEPLSCILDPTENEGGLYLGNLEAAQNVAMLKMYNIRAVLTVAQGTGLNYPPGSIEYHEIIQAEDVESQDLFAYFEQCLAFFDKYRQYGSVFCHCFAGVSRSATMVIAYLMKRYNYSLADAFNLVRNRRSHIYPNQGFIRQLRSFEQLLLQQRVPTAVVQSGYYYDAPTGGNNQMYGGFAPQPVYQGANNSPQTRTSQYGNYQQPVANYVMGPQPPTTGLVPQQQYMVPVQTGYMQRTVNGNNPL